MIEDNIPNPEEKKKQLFLDQKKLLDTFPEHGAISKAQYEKSLGDLIVKMGMEEEIERDHLRRCFFAAEAARS